jgi:predicted P-loop ATPase
MTVYDLSSRLRKNQGAQGKKNVKNIDLSIMEAMGNLDACFDLQFCTFRRRLLSDGRDVGEALNSIVIAVHSELAANGINCGIDKAQALLLRWVRAERSTDSLSDWANNLPAWDGKERIDTWTETYLGAAPTAIQYGAKWLVSGIARALNPSGIDYEGSLILYGPQGKGKSAASRLICPRLAGEEGESAKLFGEIRLDAANSKSTAENIAGKFIIEWAEMAGHSKSDQNQLKDLLTKKTDTYRPAYAVEANDFVRRCIFIGTTNQKDFLRDETGSRRFWIVEIGNVDFDALDRDRLQLWAEAKERYLAAPNDRSLWTMTESERALHETMTHEYVSVGECGYELEGLLEKHTVGEFIPAETIKQYRSIAAVRNDNEFSRLMKHFGFQPKRTSKARGWERN